MPENISTYWAKNVKIKRLRGIRFEFVLILAVGIPV